MGKTSMHGAIFRGIYRNLLSKGVEVAPRGQKVVEVENFAYRLPPYVRFINFAARKLSVPYIKKEFLWYLKGDPKDLSITEHAKLWKSMVTDRGTINSNYGQYMFGDRSQFDYVVETLKKDPDSRRASMMILSKDHVLSGDADLPCTYGMNFRIRNGYLNMTVRMRSQDAIFGMGSDVPCFSFIHEMVLRKLQSKYPELKYGEYFHSADSFHVYERHYEMIRAIVGSDPYTEVAHPPMYNGAEVDFLLAGKFDLVPEEFAFTQWLIS